MKKFIKLERIITEEQLAEINELMNKKYRPLGVKSVLAEMGTNFCSCGEISTHQL